LPFRQSDAASRLVIIPVPVSIVAESYVLETKRD
jgi:hypothetical protein